MVHPSTSPIVIVALGAGLARGQIGFATKLRATAAAVLYHRHPTMVIMSGGETDAHQRTSEAEAMRDYVTRHGWHFCIPTEDVLIEPHSLSTPENVRNVVALLRKMHLDHATVLLIAGRRNRLLAADYFRAENFSVHPFTVRQILVRFSSIRIPDTFDPKLSPRDRKYNFLMRCLQVIDPRGTLASSIGRWMRRR